MLLKIVLSNVAIALALATFACGSGQEIKASENSRTKEIVTMANMRSLVPKLVLLGWDDFFLNRPDETGLSTSQTKELQSLRLAFLAAREEGEQLVKNGILALYEELDQGQVSDREVEARVRWVSVLRGQVVALRFRYLLRAINVLDHEQHRKLAASLDPARPLQIPPVWDPQQFKQQDSPSEAFPRSALLPVQYAGDPYEDWKRTELGRCSAQASVSVEALLSYEQGREAARKLMKLADKLRKLAKADWPVEQERARKLVAQMKPEFWLVEQTDYALRPLVTQGSDEEFAQLAIRLRTEPIGTELTQIARELSGDDANSAALVQQAKQLKELAKRWRADTKKIGEELCLQPLPVFLLQ